jgi:polyisoprenyl-teichoic acid--peptidoglycan teichoic acid transferase
MTKTITRPTRKRKKTDRLTSIVLVVFILIIAITVLVAIVMGVNVLFNSDTTGTAANAVDTNSSTASIGLPSGPQADQPLQSSAGPTSKGWDGSSRVTLLMMGLDYRDWEEGGTASRTDSMMLITYDPASNTAGMLSIPRDLWVEIPQFGYAKINTAYYLGEVNNLPGGGPALAVQTVEQFLGVPINFYAQIDFSAFEKFIDGLGGLDIKIKTPITIDPLGPGNTKTLQPGTQTLSGAEALAYARQRHTDHGDVDRAERQQEVIMAIRNQIFNLNMLPGLISKSPKIYSDIAAGLRTNLTLSQVVQLALAAQRIPKENIKQAVIGTDDTQLDMSADGQSILIPIPENILLRRDTVFGASSAPVSSAPAASAATAAEVSQSDNPDTQTQANEPAPVAAPVQDLGALMATENARLIVQNGTITTGVAGRVKDYLESLGMNVVKTENAEKQYKDIVLIDYTGKTSTLKFLAQMMQVPDTRIFSQNNPDAGGDIAIIIGDNWPNVLNLP